jgi:ATP-dependent RNA helicase DeaD
MPEPEDLIANTPEARREAQKERHRPGFEDVVWFRMDLGRRQNADPRWILPLLCRRGHITRNEIGAIRIGTGETYFQIPRQIADKFADAAARTAQSDGEDEPVTIELSQDGPPDFPARGKSKRNFSRNNAGGARVKPKPRFNKFDKNKGKKRDTAKKTGKPSKGSKTFTSKEGK